MAEPSVRGRLRPGKFVKRFLPRGLFGRSLIIIVAPMVLLQGVVSYVFFERDLDVTTRRLARDVAGEVAFLVSLKDNYPAPAWNKLRNLAEHQLLYRIRFEPGPSIGPTGKPSSTIEVALDDIIAERIGGGRHFLTSRRGDTIDIRVDVQGGILDIAVPRERVTVSQPDIFILWMAGSALILLAVAILFLRNQVRPIERLARAADSFGKGRPVPDFKPYGAIEVRRAAQAFLTMRERIERHVAQRTEMLAGVSHDLKTPLTRMKLALAMLDDNAEIEALSSDIAEMEYMLDAYLAFARGEGGEDSKMTDLGELVRDAASAAAKARRREVEVEALGHLDLSVKRAALRRCVTNLVDNALKHGRHVRVRLKTGPHYAEICVEDDGPGIAPDRREEAFRPFHRLDQGRNLQAGGSGLGLSIARDIARAHGGDILLGDSVLGGLSAAIRLPL